MSSISNGPQGYSHRPGRDEVVPGSVRDCEDTARSLGYDSIDFEPRGREVVATSYNAKGYRVQAIGRDRVTAAQQLIRTLTR